MAAVCKKIQPTGLLECIAGEMFGKIFAFVSPGGTAILYGLLSEKPCGGIGPFNLIGMNKKIEGFLLGNASFVKDKEKWPEVTAEAQKLMKTDLRSNIAGRYPLQ